MKTQSPLHSDCPPTDNGQRLSLSVCRGFNSMEKPRLIEDLGMLYPTSTSKKKLHYGLFECPFCEKIFKTAINSVDVGHTKSCGCYMKKRIYETHFKHGFRNTKLYKVWGGMKERCYNKSCGCYDDYGGRDIIVCNDWINNASNFCNWAIENGYREGLQIDRINNDGNYEPSNCRFSTSSTNAQNRRLLRSNNTSGYRCVYMSHNKWDVAITSKGVIYKLGRFNNPEDAAYAYNCFIIRFKTYHPLNILSETYIPMIGVINKIEKKLNSFNLHN